MMREPSQSPLLQEIIERLPWLFERGAFQVIGDVHEPRVFGNDTVTLESPVMRLRFIGDRSHFYIVQFASRTDQERWWDLGLLLEAIEGKLPEPNSEPLAVASLLTLKLPILAEALGPRVAETRRELQRRLDIRAESARRRAHQR